MQTTIAVGSPQNQRNWATSLAVDYGKMLWWKKFVGTSENSIVQEKIDLSKNAGDTVQFDLSMRFKGDPVYGDNRAEGKEEGLDFLQDELKIDQMRKPASAGGAMSQQRTVHDLRRVTRDRLAEYMAEWMDEVCFVYSAGDVGNSAYNQDSIFRASAFAGNPIEAPDDAHMVYGGDATSKADLAATDKMSVTLIERTVAKAKMLNATNPNVVSMRPIKMGAEEHFVVLMSPWQEHDMRVSAGDREWVEIQKAAGQRGAKNPLFNGKLGMISNTVLQVHEKVRLFNDYGAGGDVLAARALFLGRQALTKAYGSGSGARMKWVEKKVDYDNEIAIAAGMICGIKKTRFKPESGQGTDFGVMALDTAAAPAA
jgi:N4-gp56 family major capsid protein